MIEEKYKQKAEAAVSLVEGIKRTGLTITGMRDRYVKMLMPLEGNVNHVGIMYAGSLFTIGEITGGIYWMLAFDMQRFFPVVKEINIQFKMPATTDVTLEKTFDPIEARRIQTQADEVGKADFTLNLELKDANDQVVSLVNGVWQIRRIQQN